MNGARSFIQSLLNAGVEVCFANPGTSEMHLVQAMDAEPAFRGVLCLFEGVCTGASDGYARIAGKPAVTLLHLGPGLGNGIANLHNARRAASPIINLVGNHTLDNEALDAPLTSDIETLAKNVSSWIKTDSTAESLAADGLAALAAVMQKAPWLKGPNRDAHYYRGCVLGARINDGGECSGHSRYCQNERGSCPDCGPVNRE